MYSYCLEDVDHVGIASDVFKKIHLEGAEARVDGDGSLAVHCN